MKNLPALFSRAALAVAAALALGACSRAEYAMLPRSASYLGTKPVAAVPRPAAPAPAAAVATPTAAPAQVAPPEVATAPAVAPVRRPAAAPVASIAPATSAAAYATSVAPAEVAPAPTPKLNLIQRLALKRVSKQLTRLAASSPQLKQRDAAASTARISGNLRTGIILLVIGLLVGLLNGFIGTIIAIIGLVFIVLWLLDEL